MRWRSRLILLHRDVGFFCLGLTFVYAISGIAVNHRHHWDYNYSATATTRFVGTPKVLLGLDGRTVRDASPGDLARREQGRIVEQLLEISSRSNRPRKVFWRGPDRLSLFFGDGDNDVIDYLPSRGLLNLEQKRPRFLVRQLNVLHLNEPRGVWTYVADGYAALLLFLAVSGAIVVRGRRGLRGRGGWLLTAGVGFPILALMLLR